MAKKDTPPRWDRKMQQRLARGEAAALGELYDRFASLVHSLAHRVLDDDEAADRVTREVFAHIWENPDAYDPKQGPMRSWVATLTHRQAVQRLRQTETAALAQGGEGTAEELERKVRSASVAARADYIVTPCPRRCGPPWSWRTSSAGTTARPPPTSGVTEDEARRRLRLGLQLLSTAHDAEARRAPRPESGAPHERGTDRRAVRRRTRVPRRRSGHGAARAAGLRHVLRGRTGRRRRCAAAPGGGGRRPSLDAGPITC